MSETKRPAIAVNLPAREADGHKGTYGRVLAAAGSEGMAGAAGLVGRAALRGGAGLVTVACPRAVAPIVASYEPCYLTKPLPCDEQGRLTEECVDALLQSAHDVLAFGPGLGQSERLRQLTARVLAQSDRPAVVDADGLNLLVGQLDVLKGRQAPTALTPHPGELARLIGASVSQVQSDRQGLAQRFAAEHGVIVLLKGSQTVVTDGRRVCLNPTGNPGMASGGTGDVLTGLIAALIGQKLSVFDAAVLGAYLHGLAGDLSAQELGQASLTAADLVETLPRAFLQYASLTAESHG